MTRPNTLKTLTLKILTLKILTAEISAGEKIGQRAKFKSLITAKR